MPSTLSVVFASKLTVTETFTGQVSSVDNTIIRNGLDEGATYTASTTVPVTKQAVYTLTLSSGTGSIDLTALPGLTADETVVGTGLKLQFLKLSGPTGNANNVTVTKGASNGYGWGSAGSTFTVVVAPGQSILLAGNDLNPDVASGARILDVTGTGSQTLTIHAILG